MFVIMHQGPHNEKYHGANFLVKFVLV